MEGADVFAAETYQMGRFFLKYAIIITTMRVIFTQRTGLGPVPYSIFDLTGKMSE